MASAAIPVREKGQTTCAHLKGRQLEMFCEKCHDLICMKCLSSIHKSHAVCELSEITSEKKQDIKNFIDRTEQNDLVEIGKYIASTDSLLKDNDRSFDKLSHQLRMQTEKLKQELDKLTTETLFLYQQMKADNANLIQKYKNDLDTYNKQLKHVIQICKTALQQGSDIEIHDTKCVIDSQLHLPEKPDLGTVTFTPNANPQNHLKQALGKVVKAGQDQTSIEMDPSSDGHLQSCTQHQTGDIGDKAVTRTTLLTQTRVVEEWESPCDIKSLCPTIDDKTWTNYYETLTLLDRKGKVIQKVTHESCIKDISLSPTTHRLWTLDIYNNILELVSGQLTQRFRAKEIPRCICVTSSDHVLVGMFRYICKHSPQGQVVQTTKAAVTGEPLVGTPQKITECPVTNNVAVIYDSVDSCVVVVDTNFQQIFVYRGEIPSRYKQTPRTEDRLFRPLDIVYDSQGNIIIGDCNNKRLLLLSGRGEVLRILHTDTESVWLVGIDRHDIVWSGFGNIFHNKVKLLQYSSNT